MSTQNTVIDPRTQPEEAALLVLVELIRADKINRPSTGGNVADVAIKQFDLLHAHFKGIKKS